MGLHEELLGEDTPGQYKEEEDRPEEGECQEDGGEESEDKSS